MREGDNWYSTEDVVVCADFRAALEAGKVPKEIAERFVNIATGLLAPLLSNAYGP
jgi:hypothetical protein